MDIVCKIYIWITYVKLYMWINVIKCTHGHLKVTCTVKLGLKTLYGLDAVDGSTYDGG